MPTYFRKSIKVGPLRFNLSKSGVGVSAGIPGFRIGSGPRGNYIHIGAGGLYYRRALPFNGQPNQKIEEPRFTPSDHGTLKKIDSACVSQMSDSTSEELLREINSKHKKTKLWPIVATCGLVLVALYCRVSVVSLLVLAPLSIIVFAVYQRDELVKSTVLFYEFDPLMEKAYQSLHDWADHIMSCACSWYIDAKGDVYDPKYHAGARHLISRKGITIKKGSPPFLRTNISAIVVPVGDETLYLFPDRILVYGLTGVGAISYFDLFLDITQSRFIEEETLPGDAEVVDYTWRYVNKNGGPDRRFKDNYQIPICLYEEVHITSNSGLNKYIQLSRTGVTGGFKKSIEYLSKVLPRNVK